MSQQIIKSVCVIASAPDRAQEAALWAAQHGYPYATRPVEHFDYLIIFSEDRVEIASCLQQNSKPFYLDYNVGRTGFRLAHATKQNELLAKAIGLKGKQAVTVIDAAAGLGRDALLLATLGAHVIMLERSPILALLLHQALSRLDRGVLKERLQLIHVDAVSWLPTMLQSHAIIADVIYLDPMFPERTKAAAVKKEMMILRDLVGQDDDAAVLFAAAYACPVKRIVVKRPLHAQEISHVVMPTYSVKGRANRFDVYIKQQ